MGKPKRKALRSKPLFVIRDAVVEVGNEVKFHSMLKRDPLGLSIKKWEFVVRHAGKWYMDEGEEVFLGDGAMSTCGLCIEHNNCNGCPVAEYTGKWQCEGTPYYRYVNSSTLEERVRMAKAELKFLKSL